MQFEEVAKQVVGNIDTKAWQFALKHMYISFDAIDIKTAEFTSGYSCYFSKGSITGTAIINETEGYIFGSNLGLLIVCPMENDFPIVDFVNSKHIRVVEAESKLFKAYIRVKTNDNMYIFRVDKKKLSEIEKFVNKIRYA